MTAPPASKSPSFRMGRLDHVHIRVPDRDEAARWYAEHLGFARVAKFEFWAEGFPRGPLQISADGGETMLALFEATESHPMIPQKTGIAFSLGAEELMAFARSLPGGLKSPSGTALRYQCRHWDVCRGPRNRRNLNERIQRSRRRLQHLRRDDDGERHRRRRVEHGL